MRRSIIALTAFAAFSFATIGVNAFPVNQDAVTEFVQDNRTEIQYDELPDAVKTAFEESEHSEMEVSTVFQVEAEDGTQYELTVSDGTENTTTLLYDAEGNVIG